MVTDDERRRVAEALRNGDTPSLMKLMRVLRVGGKDIFARLTDLIEPSCDREALLALAEEFDAKADDIAAYIESCDGYFDEAAIHAERENREHAHRIREACGEVA